MTREEMFEQIRDLLERCKKGRLRSTQKARRHPADNLIVFPDGMTEKISPQGWTDHPIFRENHDR
jgi:hypothetical protein